MLRRRSPAKSASPLYTFHHVSLMPDRSSGISHCSIFSVISSYERAFSFSVWAEGVDWLWATTLGAFNTSLFEVLSRVEFAIRYFRWALSGTLMDKSKRRWRDTCEVLGHGDGFDYSRRAQTMKCKESTHTFHIPECDDRHLCIPCQCAASSIVIDSNLCWHHCRGNN